MSLERLEERRLLDGEGLLSGVVFHDLDRDGTRDEGETGLSGWTLEVQKIGASDSPRRVVDNPTPDPWSQFGRFVTAVGENVLVSSHYDDVAGPAGAGAAYLFDGVTGDLLRTFVSPRAEEDARFGRALTAVGGNVLIGAPMDDMVAEDSGAAYLFDGATGELLRTLVSPSGGAGDQFGRAVAAVGDDLLIGARLDDVAGEDSGAVYLFDGETGELLHTFVSPTAAENAQFGYSVAALGDDVLVGARYDDTGANGIGAAYLFDGETGRLLRRFTNPTQRANGEPTGFGRSLAAVGDDVVIGARWDDSGADGAGSAFVFDGATGELLHTLSSPTPFYREEFGMSVAALGDDVLVGARWDNRWDELGEQSGGAAYLFDGTTGELLQTFANPSPGAWDAFGISVAATERRVIVGAQDGNAAYLFNEAVESSVGVTDDDGGFTFEGLEAGTYRLMPRDRAGYSTTSPYGPLLITLEEDGQVTDLSFARVANESPVAAADRFTVLEDQALVISAESGVLVNDVDPDGDPISAVVVNPPPNGSLTLQVDGSLRYEPNDDFFGTDLFTYRASDGVSHSNLMTVTVEVTPVNDAPVAVDDGGWLPVNTVREVPAPGVLSDDIDADGDVLSAVLVDEPSRGTVELASNGSYRYVPDDDYSGPDQFTYQVWDGTAMSAPATVRINVSVNTFDALTRNLRVSEINYYPHAVTAEERQSGLDEREAFEFVELVNTGAAPMDLWGVELDAAVRFEFEQTTILSPGERAVLVKDQPAFVARYGAAPRILGQYEGEMHNSGDEIRIRDPFDRVIQGFRYDDEGDWPLWADGFGASLEVVETLAPYEDGRNWRASGEFGGSPGVAGQGYLGTVVVNEVLTHSNLPHTDAVELHNRTDQPIDVGGWFLSESANDFRKFRIPDGTVIPAGGYVWFDEYDFNPGRWTPGAGGFAFDSAEGDDVWLTAADPEGRLTYFMDHLEFDAALSNESFGRWPDGTGPLYPMSSLTLGNENSGPRLGMLAVSEVMYDPPGGGDDLFEYIEVFNTTTESVDLRNWQIRGDVDFNFPDSYTPEPVYIHPGESVLVVPFRPSNEALREQFLTFYSLEDTVQLFGPLVSLPNARSRIELLRPDAPPWWEPHRIPHVLVEAVGYDVEAPWPDIANGDGGSLHRVDFADLALESSGWTAGPPTPGQVNLQIGDLLVAEIHYHPTQPTAAERAVDPDLVEDDFEFLELLNISGGTLDVSGMRFSSGISFVMPDAQLPTGARVVLVRNEAAFRLRYGDGIPVLGQYQGTLSNGGDTIALRNAEDQVILAIAYDDSAGWPQRADGQGSSLQLVDAHSDYGSGASWRDGTEYGGSPGVEGLPAIEQVVINEILIDGDDHANDRIELYNSTGGAVDVGGWYLSDSGSDPTKYRIPDGTIVPAYGYLVVEGDDFVANIDGQGFVLDEYRDNDLHLLSVDAAGALENFVDSAHIGASRAGVSWGRWPDRRGGMLPMSVPTFDALDGANSGPAVGPLVVTEVMYHPSTTGDRIAQDDLEYVEIYNTTGGSIDLDGWEIQGGIRHRFAVGTMLAPREVLVLVRFDVEDAVKLDAFRDHYDLRPWVDVAGGLSGSLSNAGDEFWLMSPGTPPPDDPQLIPMHVSDQVAYSDDAPWPVSADGLGLSLSRVDREGWGGDVGSWTAAQPTLGFIDPSRGDVAVSEVNYHPHPPTEEELAADPTLTADDFEFVELLNVSGATLDLDGYRVEVGGDVVMLENLTIGAARRLLLVSSESALRQRYTGLDSVAMIGFEGSLSDESDGIRVVDPSGETVVEFVYGDRDPWSVRADGHGSSLEIIDLSGYYNDPDNWRASTQWGGSPGGAGSRSEAGVVINEVLASAGAAVDDAIELYNVTSQPIDVGGWYLSNDWDDYRRFRIPDDTVIPGSGFLVFTGQDFQDVEMELDDLGGRLWLTMPGHASGVTFVDEVTYGASSGRTFGRTPDGRPGDLVFLAAPTIDPENPQQGANSPEVNHGSIIVTELNYHPESSAHEFLELYNAGPWPVDLTGLRFDQGIEFDFENALLTTLEAGQYAVLVRYLDAFQEHFGPDIPVIGQYQGGLSNSGETIRLVSEQEVIVEIEYEDGGEWSSLPDGDGVSLELIDVDAVPAAGPDRTAFLGNPAHWRPSATALGSPGRAGVAMSREVVINEILFSHWIPDQTQVELYNATDAPVDIGGWYVTDDIEWLKYPVPHGTTIPAGGYVVVDSPNFLRSFRLFLTRYDEPLDSTVMVDYAILDYAVPKPDDSMGRWPDTDGNMTFLTRPTPGEDNAPPRAGSVIVSEIHYHPAQDLEEDDLEFIELYNPTGHDVDLRRFWMDGGIGSAFVSEDVIPAGGTLLVLPFNPRSAGNADRLTNFLETYELDPDSVNLAVNGYGGKLSNRGETISLYNNDHVEWGGPLVEDKVSYADHAPWPVIADGRGFSLHREEVDSWGQESGSWVAAAPSPGRVDQLTVDVAPHVLSVRWNLGQTDITLPDGTRPPTSWSQQASRIDSITVMFNEIVNVAPHDFRLVNLGVDAPVDADRDVVLTADQIVHSGNRLTIDLTGTTLDDGVYRLEVFSTVTDLTGDGLDGNRDGAPGDTFVFSGSAANGFYVLAADFNGDGGVSIFDFATFAHWFGRSTDEGEAPAYADLDGDGGVSIFDFPLFADNFGRSVRFPTAGLLSEIDAIGSFLPGDEQPRPSAAAGRSEESRTRLVDAALVELLRVDDPAPVRQARFEFEWDDGESTSGREREVTLEQVLADVAIR